MLKHQKGRTLTIAYAEDRVAALTQQIKDRQSQGKALGRLRADLQLWKLRLEARQLDRKQGKAV